MVKFKIKESVLLMILGLSGMIFGLSSESITFIEKIPITMFGFGMIIVGILIETPILDRLKGTDENDEFT